jgi:hypothetical protein
MRRVNQSEARVLTQAEHADEAARLARARIGGAVRRKRCGQCGAGAYGPCSVRPAGDCLARYLTGYADGRISRGDLIGAISGLVVITTVQLVEERAA